MILYFDSFITDRALNPKPPEVEARNIRKKVESYHMPKKLDIAKYTLASYAMYPWSHVLVKYELQNPSENEDFERFVVSVFPKAQIIRNRSADQVEYQKSLEILEQLPDEWIFFSPNNDHPLLISRPEQVYYMDRLIEKAGEYKKKYPFVSIAYSHFSEYIQAARPRSANHRYFGQDTCLVGEDEDALYFTRAKGDFNSIQIVHRDLFRHWFTSMDMSNAVIYRAENLSGKVSVEHQLVIAPRQQLCAHFDGYEHMLGTVNEIWTELIPPLIIPAGFFESNIRIAYGYDQYKQGYTNLNPAAKYYSFEDPVLGTDIKMSLGDIPLFWKPRIREIDTNPAADMVELERAARRQQAIIENPWSVYSQGISLRTLKFHARLYLARLRPFFVSVGLIGFIKKYFA